MQIIKRQHLNITQNYTIIYTFALIQPHRIQKINTLIAWSTFVTHLSPLWLEWY